MVSPPQIIVAATTFPHLHFTVKQRFVFTSVIVLKLTAANNCYKQGGEKPPRLITRAKKKFKPFAPRSVQ